MSTETFRELIRPRLVPTEAQRQAAERAHHEAAERAALPARLREWRIPRAEWAALLAGDAEGRETAALKHVRQFHRGGRDWALVLWGGYRVGKTYAAVRWLVEAARVPVETLDLGATFRFSRSARFIPFADLADAAGSYRDHHRALIAEAIAARALVLDDVGAQGRCGAPILDQVISARHANRRLTLITTNLGRDLFARADHYGLRVAMRLQEGGAFRGCGAMRELEAPLSRRERGGGEGAGHAFTPPHPGPLPMGEGTQGRDESSALDEVQS